MEQTNFRFDTHDLEIIHEAVERWAAERGCDLGAPESLTAARLAFFTYRDGMTEDELLTIMRGTSSVHH